MEVKGPNSRSVHDIGYFNKSILVPGCQHSTRELPVFALRGNAEVAGSITNKGIAEEKY